jgi:nucleoside-diphosphate-sugar epimerase
MNTPETIANETELDALLTQPDESLTAMMRALEGDIMILGIGGKMGLTLGAQAVNAVREAGVEKDVIGVSRFSESGAQSQLEAGGLKTIGCDLLDPDEVAKLPATKNIIYMAGRKFGTGGGEAMTWAMNTVVPANIGRHFKDSRVVVFSSGAVYGRMDANASPDTEETPSRPKAEYGQSVVGRERVFEYFSRQHGLEALHYRLYYAIDLRYGVLHDIASWIWNDAPVPLNVDTTTAIWQGDANRYAIMCLDHCSAPPNILNIGSGPLSVRDIATQLASHMGKDAQFTGTESGVGAVPDVSKCASLFGEPQVHLEQMIRWQAHWTKTGGRSLEKPTGFHITDGVY